MKPFSYWSSTPDTPLPHVWTFPSSLALDIRPRDNKYVYIDGAFRPAATKLIELLSGNRLYSNPLHAVRELLQNAFDAISEKIATTRLTWQVPKDSLRGDALRSIQNVELSLEWVDGRQWIVCRYTGIGMTKEIISDYLLVPGRSRRRQVVQLSRRCETAGFALERSGQFGIGLLSYFMIADRVEFLTRRDDPESLLGRRAPRKAVS
jgi:HSP90 family molecular chaperone